MVCLIPRPSRFLQAADMMRVEHLCGAHPDTATWHPASGMSSVLRLSGADGHEACCCVSQPLRSCHHRCYALLSPDPEPPPTHAAPTSTRQHRCTLHTRLGYHTPPPHTRPRRCCSTTTSTACSFAVLVERVSLAPCRTACRLRLSSRCGPRGLTSPAQRRSTHTALLAFSFCFLLLRFPSLCTVGTATNPTLSMTACPLASICVRSFARRGRRLCAQVHPCAARLNRECHGRRMRTWVA